MSLDPTLDLTDAAAARIGPSSIRVRFTLVALGLSALAVLFGSLVLLTVLRQSLVNQIDDELRERVSDVEDGVFEFGFVDPLLLPGDSDTIAVVLDGKDQIVAANFLATQLEVSGNDIFGGRSGAGVEIADFSEHRGFDQQLPFEDFGESRTLGAISISGVVFFDQEFLDDAEFLDDGDLLDTGEFVDGDFLTDEEILGGTTQWLYLARSLSSVNATVRTVRNWALIAGPLLVAFVGLLTWFLTSRSLRAVDDLRAEVDEITATADLSRRVGEPGAGDEYVRLAATMNRMLGRLEANEQQQLRFVADAAHELRSPLASINAQIDVELAHPETAEWAATAVAVRRDSARLQRIVEDLLSLARAPVATVDSSLVDLDDIAFGQAATVVRPKHVRIDVSGVQATTVRGSADQIERIVVNLLSNAVRHASSVVQISTIAMAGTVSLVVDDDGEGIAEADRDAIFDRFVRLDTARSRDRGGTGLGLALARELTVAHGGTLIVGASPIGGARFVMELPAAQ